MLSYNKELKGFSRTLRKNMTDAEKLLWSKIRGKQLRDCQFYRQKTIGNYIVDFFCPKGNLVVEVDGGQHYFSEGKQRDEIRDKRLSQMGLKVLRFSDMDVLKNIDGVIAVIIQNL
jgi:very-short-patch-repair endonuclease